MTSFAPLLQSFFTDRLTQRQANPNTIASYRDTFKLLFGHVAGSDGQAPRP
jgi:integrase/recombinase XerD